jgi:hypothetical protein
MDEDVELLSRLIFTELFEGDDFGGHYLRWTRGVDSCGDGEEWVSCKRMPISFRLIKNQLLLNFPTYCPTFSADTAQNSYPSLVSTPRNDFISIKLGRLGSLWLGTSVNQFFFCKN